VEIVWLIRLIYYITVGNAGLALWKKIANNLKCGLDNGDTYCIIRM